MRAIQVNSISSLAVFILLLFRSADGYDLRTHGSITNQSFDSSQGLTRYLTEMGIASGDVFDLQAVTLPRELAEFANAGTARGWMVEGAIREDDYQPHLILQNVFGCDPPQNPPSLIDRPLNHFFDVQRTGGGLTLAGVFSAPDWALGLQGRGPGDNQNHFSLPDARVYQLSSLIETNRVDRDRNTALMFRTLGQVIHVLQDMAQPQHTRNDPHPGCTNPLFQFVAGGKSWYEKYTETRALNQPYRSRSDASRPLVLSGYGPVGFQAYGDYWANASGSGLAEFSSRNFFSAGTNLGSLYLAGPCGGLPQPACDPRAYRTEDFDFTIPTLTGGPLTGRLRFFLRDIADPLTGQVVPGIKVSSRSLWDQHLETNRRQPKFALNTYNYDSIADVLLPRAVGYSAGLLDHFFRGRLDVDVVADPDDSSKLRVVGKLVSRNGGPDELVSGALAFYWDDTDGVRSPVPGFAPMALTGVTGDPIASASFQPPEGAERFVAVYQGALGQEQGAVIGKVGVGGGGVEELFIEQNTLDIYFRNVNMVAPLDVAQYLNIDGSGIPGVPNFPDFCDGRQRVMWGADGESFAVRYNAGTLFDCQTKWAIFSLSRRPPGATYAVPPEATLLEIVDDTPLTGPTGRRDDARAHFLDRYRHLLYSANREVRNDTSQVLDGVLVDLKTRSTLRQYPADLLGEFGGQLDFYVVYADSQKPEDDVYFVVSFAYLDHRIHGVDAATPARFSVYKGDSKRLLVPNHAFGSTRQVDEVSEPFSSSFANPVAPQSNRHHVIFAVVDQKEEFVDGVFTADRVYTVYVYSVDQDVLHIAGRDHITDGSLEFPVVAVTRPYMLFGGAASTDADELYQGGEWDLVRSPSLIHANGAQTGDIALPAEAADKFIEAWSADGTPTLDLTAPFPKIASALSPKARLKALGGRFVLTANGFSAAPGASNMDVYFVGIR